MKRPITFLKWSFLVIVIGLIVVMSLSTCDPFFVKKEFNQSKWISGDERTRGEMVHDLVGKKILDGKTKPEVIEMLGKGYEGKDGSLFYVVDTGQRFVFDKWLYRLIIFFDSDGKVTNYGTLD
jgi:hypothetical protein